MAKIIGNVKVDLSLLEDKQSIQITAKDDGSVSSMTLHPRALEGQVMLIETRPHVLAEIVEYAKVPDKTNLAEYKSQQAQMLRVVERAISQPAHMTMIVGNVNDGETMTIQVTLSDLIKEEEYKTWNLVITANTNTEPEYFHNQDCIMRWTSPMYDGENRTFVGIGL